MSNQTNATLGHDFFMAQDRLHGGPDPDLCAPGYRATIGGNPTMDLAGHQGFARAFFLAFPDMHHTIVTTVADEERVAVEFVLKGTHRADFMGLPATGKPVEVRAIAILEIAGGRVTGLRAVFDQFGMMAQLGALAV